MPHATQVRVTKPPILPIFGRIVFLTVALLVAAGAALTWFAKGITWAFDADRGYSPLVSCPTFIINADGAYPDGPTCRMSLRYSFGLASSISAAGLMTTNPGELGLCALSSPNSPESIICLWDSSCDDLCQTVDNGGRCPSPSTLQNPQSAPSPTTLPQCTVVIGSMSPTNMPCFDVSMESFCDNAFAVTPSNEIAMRGIIIASLVIVLIWTIAEFTLRAVDISIRTELAIGKLEQSESLPSKIAQLRALVEERWAQKAVNRPVADADDLASSFGGSDAVSLRSAGHHQVGPSPLARQTMPRYQFNSPAPSGASTPRSGFGAGQSGVTRQLFAGNTTSGFQDPRLGYSSASWKRRLRQYHALRADKKHQFQTRQFMRSLALTIVYIGLIVVTLFVVVSVSPQHISVTSGSLINVLLGQISVWQIHSALDVIIFADILLDFGLFLVAAICVQWPRAPVFSRHLQRKLGEYIRKRPSSIPDSVCDRKLPTPPTPSGDDLISEDSLISEIPGLSSRDTQSLSFVLKQSLAFDCCLMIACHESTLTAEKSTTFANTLRAALLIFPPAHIFICDNGSSIRPVDDTQSVAREVHPDINYLYVPEGNKTFAFYWCNKYWIPTVCRAGLCPSFAYAVIIDDDVPLPSDLHIPHEHLGQHPEIKAVHFPITAAAADGHPNMLINCQDIEYKLAAVHKQFQAKVSRCLSCHGAIAMWERKAMGEVFFMHDTVFHGEDMYMGLCLLRRRDKSTIVSAAQSIVPTYAPSSFSMLFRQRVKSWELTSHRKSVTYIKELFNPRSFCHVPSLTLKPYFLQEVITILLDWLRVYLLCGLLLRDWVGLLLMTGFFMLLMYIQVLMFTYLVLRSRKELRPTALTVILFPFYRLCGLLFRICALCQNMLVYSHDRASVKIGKREDEIKDIPPTPPSHLVDWFTVWTEPQRTQQSTV